MPEGPWTKAGVIAGIVAAVLAIFGFLGFGLHVFSSQPSVAKPHTTPPPAGTAASTSSPIVYREDFSGRTAGWTYIGSNRAGGYINGAYHIYANPSENLLAEPEQETKVYPVAPSNITIDVVARRIAGSARADQYGIGCRIRNGTDTGYYFRVGDGYAAITKLTSSGSQDLAAITISTVHANARNQLHALCTSVEGEQAVHLVFFVNGQQIADVTDAKNPLPAGTVGLFVSNGSAETAMEAEFDDFVAAQV